MMRRLLVIVALSVAGAGLALAQVLHAGTGVVRGIYPEEKSITITHDPMPSLRMGAMTMVFDVPDVKLLAGLKIAQRVEFQVEQRGDDYIIRAIKPRR